MRNYGTRFECLQMRPHDHIGWTFAAPAGFVDAPTQRATFADALADAAVEGDSGIRVAADNTPLVTGLCAFDGERVSERLVLRAAAPH